MKGCTQSEQAEEEQVSNEPKKKRFAYQDKEDAHAADQKKNAEMRSNTTPVSQCI